MAAVLGGPIVFAEHMPGGLLPALLLQDGNEEALKKLGKHTGLTILNDKPWNIETPAHLLDDEVTPADRMFLRNNGLMPTSIDPATWTLTIDGEAVTKPVSFTLAELKEKFTHHSYRLVLECGGNGRAEFDPPAKGNQWTVGAVQCAEWTGVRLKDVLNAVGVKSNAVYIGYYGGDTHLSGDPDKVVISRGVPMAKALEDETLLAFAMNGKDIPLAHGHPLRLVVGGWPASASGKWLKRIAIRDRVHDGPKMTGDSYRVPCKPVEPGEKVPDEGMCIIESMPVKSVITSPKSGAILDKGRTLELRGHAWAGDLSVKRMEVSIDFGASWQAADLKPAHNRLAWQRWTANVKFPETGYYEVWARATDSSGRSQPMVVPGWNPKGYLNNATHRIAVRVR
ncbi:MAG: sulfite oxidase [Flavobacteriales bacterium]|nr:sulfite oxidase [Flavobacteriales bacterium]HPQ59711.1 sulfite oxidase [Flavobacteriales bacterium]